MLDREYEPDQRIRRDPMASARNPRAPHEVRLRIVAEIDKSRRAGKAVKFRLAREYSRDEVIWEGWNHQRALVEGRGQLMNSLKACLWPDLQRWAVNFLRHEETNYESLLVGSNSPAAAARNAEIKRAVLRAIGRTYPELAAECRRQRHQSVAGELAA